MQHIESREHGAARVVRRAHRRAPEGHERIADEFIERALVLEDRVRHRREVRVQDLHDLLRAQGFGQAGELADVGEQDRDVLLAADLGAQVVLVFIHHLGEDRRRDVLGQHHAHPLLVLALGEGEAAEDDEPYRRHRRERRHHVVDDVALEPPQRPADEGEQHHERESHLELHPRQQQDSHAGGDGQHENHDDRHERRDDAQKILVQDVARDGGVQHHARRAVGDGGGLQVLEAGRARADEHDLVAELVRVDEQPVGVAGMQPLDRGEHAADRIGVVAAVHVDEVAAVRAHGHGEIVQVHPLAVERDALGLEHVEQRDRREHRVETPLVLAQQARAPEHAVAIALELHHARAPGRAVERGEGQAEGVVEARRKTLRVRDGEALLEIRRDRLVEQGLVDFVGFVLVDLERMIDPRALARGGDEARVVRSERAGGDAVAALVFREQHVEDDRPRLPQRQELDEVGEHRARPRPAPDQRIHRLERGLIHQDQRDVRMRRAARAKHRRAHVVRHPLEALEDVGEEKERDDRGDPERDRQSPKGVLLISKPHARAAVSDWFKASMPMIVALSEGWYHTGRMLPQNGRPRPIRSRPDGPSRGEKGVGSLFLTVGSSWV